MRTVKIWMLSMFLMVSTGEILWGQGCSDAGFCTLNGMHSNALSPKQDKLNQIKFGLSKGQGDYQVGIWSSYLEYSRHMGERLTLTLKTTFMSQKSDLASSSGLADLFFSGVYSMDSRLSITFGIKIPLMDGNVVENGLSLPLDFQPSLGSTDLILGLVFKKGDFGVDFGWQQPLSHGKNEFRSDAYPLGSDFGSLQTTHRYRRQGDVLARASYRISMGRHLTFTPGLLAIYHLADDQYTDVQGINRAIDGSAGLTLNGNLYLDYAINSGHSVGLIFGAPLVTRDVRPDGLTRRYVFTVEYRFIF